MVSSLPGMTKEYPDMGIAEEKCLRSMPTRPNQPLMVKINLGSKRGLRRRLIFDEVVEGSSKSLDGPDAFSAVSSISRSFSNGMALEILSLIPSSWTLPGQGVFGAGRALYTSRSPSSGIRSVDASISELEARRFNPCLR